MVCFPPFKTCSCTAANAALETKEEAADDEEDAGLKGVLGASVEPAGDADARIFPDVGGFFPRNKRGCPWAFT